MNEGECMEYIWEYFCGINNVDVHIQQAEIISPYYEMPPEQGESSG